MVSSTYEKIQNLKNSIVNKVNTLISAHNLDSSAHPNLVFNSENKITYMSIDEDLNLYIGYDTIEELSIIGSNSIIQSGETNTLSATVLTKQNIPLEGVPIAFYNGNQLLETNISDDSGIANYTYTGNGSGKKQITAKAGSVVSEIYEVYDYINFDNGLDVDCSNIWTGNTEDLTRQSDGSLFSSTSTKKLLSSALISGDFEATFQAYGVGSPLWGVEDANNNRTRYYMRNDESFTYYKITRSNGVFSAKYSLDGNSWSNLTAQSSDVTSADCYFLFHNNSGTKSIKFKNVKIYPI